MYANHEKLNSPTKQKKINCKIKTGRILRYGVFNCIPHFNSFIHHCGLSPITATSAARQRLVLIVIMQCEKCGISHCILKDLPPIFNVCVLSYVMPTAPYQPQILWLRWTNHPITTPPSLFLALTRF